MKTEPKTVTLLDLLDATPPWIIRLMAVEPQKCKCKTSLPVRPINADVLVERSGLSRRTFTRLSWQPAFRDAGLETVSKFIHACGVTNILNLREQIADFLSVHGKYLFKLAPRKMPKKRLRELDAQLEQWVKQHQ